VPCLLALPEAIVLDVPQKIRNDGVRLLRKSDALQPQSLYKQEIHTEVIP
jgi:hypothetical protein